MDVGTILEGKMGPQITKSRSKSLAFLEESLFFFRFSRFRNANYIFSRFGKFRGAFLDHCGGSGRQFFNAFDRFCWIWVIKRVLQLNQFSLAAGESVSPARYQKKLVETYYFRRLRARFKWLERFTGAFLDGFAGFDSRQLSQLIFRKSHKYRN